MKTEFDKLARLAGTYAKLIQESKDQLVKVEGALAISTTTILAEDGASSMALLKRMIRALEMRLDEMTYLLAERGTISENRATLLMQKPLELAFDPYTMVLSQSEIRTIPAKEIEDQFQHLLSRVKIVRTQTVMR